jgi:poly(3-hydroxybutyrate) depolymerase
MNKKIIGSVATILVIIVGIVGVGIIMRNSKSNDKISVDQPQTSNNSPIKTNLEVVKTTLKDNIVSKTQPLENLTIKIGDKDRTYILQKPESGSAAKNLIVALHGNTSTGEQLQKTLRLGDLVTQNNAVIAYPDGLNQGWNDIRVKSEDVDDIGFITQLTLSLQKEYNITKDTTTLMGVSNGGFMVQTLVCQNDSLAKNMISVISSLLTDLAEQCSSFPTNSVYVLGKKDNLVPYDGGELKTPTPGTVVSAQKTLTNVAEINKCGDKNEEKESTSVLTQKITGCPNGGQVTLITFVNEGHISTPIKGDFVSILRDNSLVR